MLFVPSLKNTQDFGKKKIQCVAPYGTEVCLWLGKVNWRQVGKYKEIQNLLNTYG